MVGEIHLAIHWNVFLQYLWPGTAFQNPLIRTGVVLTIVLAVVSMVIGILLGLVGALGRLSKYRVPRVIVTVYVTWFRSTPLIVQLALIYFGLSALHVYSFPTQTIGFISLSGAIQAGIITFGLNEGAYMTEIIRSGISSVDAGQMDAARSIGMTHAQAMRRIVLPQAVRVILPPLGNDFNGMMKSTTLVITIGAVEFFGAYQEINGVLYDPFELFLACSFYYLAFTITWSFVQGWLERRFGSFERQEVVTPKTGRLRGLLRGASATRG